MTIDAETEVNVADRAPAGDPEPITAMVSYSWDDSDAAELIHEELSLRGISVFHDQCTFAHGSRIWQNMQEAVAGCDAFIALLTPSSLYFGKPADEPRPALDDEFIPVMKRWRAGQVEHTGASKLRRLPIVIPLTCGLGDPRTEAPVAVRKATGEDISSMWCPVTIDQASQALEQADAARLAREVVRELLVARAPKGEVELLVLTRGLGEPPAFLTVDATSLVGGETNRPGKPSDWQRYLVGLYDLRRALGASTTHRCLRIRTRAHLTGCLALGRVFNQAAGWQLTIAGRHGDVSFNTPAEEDTGLDVVDDRGTGRGNLSVEIDLLGLNVRDLAQSSFQAWDAAPAGRLQFTRKDTNDLHPQRISAMAALVAEKVRGVVAEVRAQEVHVFCAAPAEFAVLLGHRLTSLHADLHLYERDGDVYEPSLAIERNQS